MSATQAPGSAAARGLMGTLRSWLQAWPREFRAPHKDRSTPPAASDAVFNDSARVLVVDDDPVSLMVISAMLESRGIVALLACDGGEAVALASELHFDLILMDVHMPILNGLRATAEIRRQEAKASRPPVPVLAYSTASVGADTLASHGLNGSLNKPCTGHELEACLSEWCPAHHALSTVRGDAQVPGGWLPGRDAGTRGAAVR